jgi:drug/metabolite transporter (DMT)-like permease
MAGPFSSTVDLLNTAGAFNYLALFLAFILLYYLFLHLLGKHSKKKMLDRVWVRKLLSAVFALILTALLYVGFFSYAGNAAAALVAIVFFVAVMFVILAAIGKLAGIDVLELLGLKGK